MNVMDHEQTILPNHHASCMLHNVKSSDTSLYAKLASLLTLSFKGVYDAFSKIRAWSNNNRLARDYICVEIVEIPCG